MDSYTLALGRPRRHRAFAILVALAGLVTSCMGDIGDSSDDAEQVDPSLPGGGSTTATGTDPSSPPPPFAPAGPVLARLTRPQYANVVRDLFGARITSHDLDADSQPYLFSVIGGATNAISELGVDLYGRAAYDITATAFADATRRKTL